MQMENEIRGLPKVILRLDNHTMRWLTTYISAKLPI